MDEDSFLELLEIYMDMTERLAEDLKLLRNDCQYSEGLARKPDDKLNQDMAIIDEVMEQYKEEKAELEP